VPKPVTTAARPASARPDDQRARGPRGSLALSWSSGHEADAARDRRGRRDRPRTTPRLGVRKRTSRPVLGPTSGRVGGTYPCDRPLRTSTTDSYRHGRAKRHVAATVPERKTGARGGAATYPPRLRPRYSKAIRPAPPRAMGQLGLVSIVTAGPGATAGYVWSAALLKGAPGLLEEVVKTFVAAVHGLTSALHGGLDVLNREQGCAAPVRSLRPFFSHDRELPRCPARASHTMAGHLPAGPHAAVDEPGEKRPDGGLSGHSRPVLYRPSRAWGEKRLAAVRHRPFGTAP
jgi:hypothetical protein